jgi:hypothetical protein
MPGARECILIWPSALEVGLWEIKRDRSEVKVISNITVTYFSTA